MTAKTLAGNSVDCEISHWLETGKNILYTGVKTSPQQMYFKISSPKENQIRQYLSAVDLSGEHSL